jgi:hypothetical protein
VDEQSQRYNEQFAANADLQLIHEIAADYRTTMQRQFREAMLGASEPKPFDHNNQI